MSDPNISNIMPINNQAVNIIRQDAREALAKAVISEGNLEDFFEPSLFNPMLQAQRFRDLDKLKSQTQKEAIEQPEEVKILDVENIDETAARFQGNNPELNQRTLLILRDLIKETDTPDEIMRKLLSVYPDPALADEALDFLLETAGENLLPALKETKRKLNEDFARQIRAGRNIGAQAREFAAAGLGSPTHLRDLYRDITGTRRDALHLFDELTDKYPYNKLKAIILFLLHSLGSDLKSKGPSIDKAELLRLIEDTKSLQGILGVFRFFQSRMKLISRQFLSYEIPENPKIRFEILSKIFVKFMAERYMNPDKINQAAKALDIEETLPIQIAVFSQMYEAIKQVAPRYFRNMQHRDELAKCLSDVLEKLEDALEEENQEKKRKGKSKKEE